MLAELRLANLFRHEAHQAEQAGDPLLASILHDEANAYHRVHVLRAQLERVRGQLRACGVVIDEETTNAT